MSKAAPDQLAWHNEATEHLIAGIIAGEFPQAYASPVMRATEKIMDLIKRRGYTPQIRRCNQLKNGDHC